MKHFHYLFLPGGTMCSHYAATAPEFFLHHSFLDKVWFVWQQKGAAYQNAHFQNSTLKLNGFSHMAKEIINSHHLPGSIKVTYSRFPWNATKKRVKRNVPEYIDGKTKIFFSCFNVLLSQSPVHLFLCTPVSHLMSGFYRTQTR